MSVSGCEAGDFECCCKSDPFIKKVSECVTTNCGVDDIKGKLLLTLLLNHDWPTAPAVIAFSKEICSNFGIDISSKLPGGHKRDEHKEAKPVSMSAVIADVASSAASSVAVVASSAVSSAVASAATASGQAMTTVCSSVPVVASTPSAVISQPAVFTGAAGSKIAPIAMAAALAAFLI
jgi:hypothetical protein